MGKGLFVLAMATMVASTFASSAMAFDAKIRDHVGTDEIPWGRVVHLVGWTKFSGASGSYACHTSASVEASSAAVGWVRAFTIPDMAKCGGTGLFNACRLKSYRVTNLPYRQTVEEKARDRVSGTIWLDGEFEDCFAKNMTLTVGDVEPKMLKAGRRIVAGTSNHLGARAAPKEVIAGFKVSGASSRADIEDIFGGKSEAEVVVSGEYELTKPDCCTWEAVEVF
jgi:hypothetical protein